MFEALNHTPFQVDVSPLFDQFGNDIAVSTVKATFKIPEEGKEAVLSDQQLSIFPADVFFYTPENSGIKYPSDIVLGKSGTDIGVIGSVYSPGDKPAHSCKASIAVGGCSKTILVYGDRFWTKNLITSGFTMTRPQKFVRMPITCDRLYGGADEDKKGNLKVYEANPHGTGYFMTKKNVSGTRVANFEDPGSRISGWKKKPLPATFGFANPTWPHRAKYAGTYDDQWKTSHWPLYPEDLDYTFFNCAQKELVKTPFLKGGEPVVLSNLTPSGMCMFRLPEYSVSIMFHLQNETKTLKANCSTLTIEPDEKRFYMVWTASVSIGKQRSSLHYAEVTLNTARSG